MTSAGATYEDDYQTCERAVAQFRIYGDALDPDQVTEQLGLQPTHWQRKGDVYTTPRGGQRVGATGLWSLSSENFVASRDLRRHLDWLIHELSHRRDALDAVIRSSGVVAYVTCIWWSRYGDGGPTLGVRQMQGLAELGIDCQFEISFYGDDEDEP